MPYTVPPLYVSGGLTTSPTPNTVISSVILPAPTTGFRYRIYGLSSIWVQNNTSSAIIYEGWSDGTSSFALMGLSGSDPSGEIVYPAPGIVLPPTTALVMVQKCNVASQKMDYSVLYYLEAGP